jgi:demethylmenaquinone methyltransferase/2-methoxy-6-polyprenyl-1,4-benzoquinol methylase
MRIADVGTGTGLVAREALAIVGPTGRVVGVDPSAEMLRRATEELSIQGVIAAADDLPFDSESFDFVSMGYALRHVGDLGTALREFRRVLKPGGRLCILEISRPQSVFGRVCLRTYLRTLARVIGSVTSLAPRTPEVWSYYWETIDRCVPPHRVVESMRDAGFIEVQRAVSLRIFSEYTATRG